MNGTFTQGPLFALSQRELVRFYRQKSRIIGSFLTPLLFWLFLGGGLSAAFPASSLPNGGTFLQYYFPANLVLTLLFVSIFANMSLIEDRHDGFLQGVLVAPASPWGIVGGKVLGGAMIALFQGTLFALLFPLAGFHLGVLEFSALVGVLFLISLMLTALGFAFAWKVDSTQGFHTVMNTLLFPMWILSGTFFPLERCPLLLRVVMYLNPLTYGYALVKNIMFGEVSEVITVPLALVVTLGYTLFFLAIGVKLSKNRLEAIK